MQKMVNLFINKYQHTMSCTEKGWVCVMVTNLEFLILSNVECISVKFNCCTLVCSKYCFLTWHLDTVLLFDKQTPLNCLIFYATLEHQLTCPTHQRYDVLVSDFEWFLLSITASLQCVTYNINIYRNNVGHVSHFFVLLFWFVL